MSVGSTELAYIASPFMHLSIDPGKIKPYSTIAFLAGEIHFFGQWANASHTLRIYRNLAWIAGFLRKGREDSWSVIKKEDIGNVALLESAATANTLFFTLKDQRCEAQLK